MTERGERCADGLNLTFDYLIATGTRLRLRPFSKETQMPTGPRWASLPGLTIELPDAA